jgi:hypothetical protein
MIRGAGRAQLARPLDGAGTLRGPEPLKPVRVALVVDPAGQGTATQVQDGVCTAARALDDAATPSRRSSRRL